MTISCSPSKPGGSSLLLLILLIYIIFLFILIFLSWGEPLAQARLLTAPERMTRNNDLLRALPNAQSEYNSDKCSKWIERHRDGEVDVAIRWQDYIEERKDVMMGKPVF